MALKPDRVIEMSSVHGTLSDVASKGVVLAYSTGGSGAVLGDNKQVYTLSASASGVKVAGVLLQDVVNIDQTRYTRNMSKEEAVIGDFVDVATKGWVLTTKYTGTPTHHAPAYLTANGVVTPTVSSTGGTVATPFVGYFGGAPDEDGYVKLEFDIGGSYHI